MQAASQLQVSTSAKTDRQRRAGTESCAALGGSQQRRPRHQRATARPIQRQRAATSDLSKEEDAPQARHKQAALRAVGGWVWVGGWVGGVWGG